MKGLVLDIKLSFDLLNGLAGRESLEKASIAFEIRNYMVSI